MCCGSRDCTNNGAAGRLDVEFLANCEWRDAIFPDLDWKYYV